MKRYFDSWRSGSGLTLIVGEQRKRRISRSRSVLDYLQGNMYADTRTHKKKRMPSASFCQGSATLLSSSATLNKTLKYMEKRAAQNCL